MKGTFISADFIENSNGDLKFLEINTDTAATTDFLSQNVWGDLIELISGSDLSGTPITEFHVIYKPQVHQNIIDNLSQSLSVSASHITSFVEHTEDLDTIYPTHIDDSDSAFILRFAYDENAILDSLYCKDGGQSLLLFNENNDLDSCVPYYYSSSEVLVDSLQDTINTDLPDFVIKSSNTSESVKFYKAGPYLSGSTYVSSSEFDSSRVANAKTYTSELANSAYLMNFLYPTETITENVVSSIRTYHIVYGASLNTLNLGGTRIYGNLLLPSGSQIDWNESTSSVVEISKKHYHEFSTSNLKEDTYTKKRGIFETENLISSSGEALNVDFIFQNWSGSNTINLKTLFISGSPDTDTPSEYLTWYHDGNTLPLGSTVSSSVVTNVLKNFVEDFTISELKVEGSDSVQYLSPTSNLLVYESSSNETKFLPIKSIDITDEAGYYSYNAEGNLVKIVENNYLILETGTSGSFYNVDVETFDYVFVGELGSVAMGIHNFFCFVAGTEILLSNRDVKNIEDIQNGDEILSYNHNTNKTETSVVGSVSSHEVDKVVRLTINNEDVIVCTPEHPFYVAGKGYQMASSLEFGDEVLNSSDEYSFISTVELLNETHTVYNLHSVKENENFFVNGILAHNKPGQP